MRLPPITFNKAKIYEASHPPQTARMNYVMERISIWCSQNRPVLEKWITPDRFQTVMRVVADEIFGASGQASLNAQIDFLLSSEGIEYYKEISERVNDLVKNLP